MTVKPYMLCSTVQSNKVTCNAVKGGKVRVPMESTVQCGKVKYEAVQCSAIPFRDASVAGPLLHQSFLCNTLQPSLNQVTAGGRESRAVGPIQFWRGCVIFFFLIFF